MAELRVMRDALLPPQQPPAERRHLLSVADLSKEDIERLLGTARSFARSLEREMKKLPTLRGRTIVNLFYESSTRTSASFELAAKRLSADTMSIKASGSAVDKGESLKDTAITLRHAASSVALGLTARTLPASLPGLVLANQASTNVTGRLIHG